MENNKPFVFGGISNDTEPSRLIQRKLKREQNKKLKKIIVTQKEIDNLIDGYYCKDRVKHTTYLCDNEYCNCLFKKNTNIERIELEINKSIILDFFTKHNIVIKSKVVKDILKSEWLTTKGRFGSMIENYIRQCKFVYDLDLIIDDIVRDKTATETYNCKNRVPDVHYCCTGGKLNKKDDDNKCRCYYSFYTQDQLDTEVLREFFITNKDILKLTNWDKTVVSFNWNILSDNQSEKLNQFLIKYLNIVIRQTQQKQQTQPVKIVKRKKITP
jgi:hypothetical protein